MVEVLFICMGNICRSPMAEAVFRHLVEQAGLAEQIAISSAGTGGWHAGEQPHQGTRAVLQRNGIACTSRAAQVTAAALERADYVVAMDFENVRDLRRFDRNAALDGKLSLLLDFAPTGTPREVPDPYYDGNFEDVYALVLAGCRGLLQHIRAERGI